MRFIRDLVIYKRITQTEIWPHGVAQRKMVGGAKRINQCFSCTNYLVTYPMTGAFDPCAETGFFILLHSVRGQKLGNTRKQIMDETKEKG
jgi:hypothetical protein